MQKKQITIVSKIRIGGELYLQEEMSQEEFRRLIDQKVDEVMKGMGFKREKTA